MGSRYRLTAIGLPGLRLTALVARAAHHRYPRITWKALGLVSRAPAEREHRAACVAYHLLVAAAVAQARGGDVHRRWLTA